MTEGELNFQVQQKRNGPCVLKRLSTTRLSLTVGQADAKKGHAFGILMALVGALRTFGAPAPLTLGV
jgi:hypothetical protein